MSHPLLERLRDRDERCRADACRAIAEDPAAVLLLDDLTEAFGIVKEMGRVDAIAGIGLELGRVLGGTGQKEAAKSVLGDAAAAFRQLGQEDQAGQVETMIAGLDEEEKE